MAYTAQIGDVGDALYREQTTNALAGNVLIDGCSVALGGSTTSIKTQVEPGVLKIGNDYPTVGGGTVTHPDGDPDNPRLDTITADSNGDVGRLVGDPMPADPPNRHYPNIRTPAPPVPNSPDEVALAVLEVPAGAGSSAELFDDYVTPHQIMGDGLNALQLIPGRDLQFVIDNAREGQTLRGDRSQTIVLDQPLTVGTQNLTIRDLNVRYADNVAQSGNDNTLTLAADGITVENVTINGNKGGQPPVAADGIAIESSNCTVRNAEINNAQGHAINVDGQTGVVADTTIDTVTGHGNSHSVVVVQGTGARRTSVQSVNGAQNEETLTVRNGAFRTTATRIYGENQPAVITIDDFGGGDAKAVIRADFEFVLGNDCDRLVRNTATGATLHRGFRFSGLGGGGFNPAATGGAGSGIVDISHMTGVKLSDSFLNDTFGDAWTIYANPAEAVTISNCTFSNNASARGCVGMFDVDTFGMIDTICDGSPGMGIRVYASDRTVGNYSITDNWFTGIAGDDITVSDSGGGTIGNVIVKDNFAKEINITVQGTDVVKKDNLTPAF